MKQVSSVDTDFKFPLCSVLKWKRCNFSVWSFLSSISEVNTFIWPVLGNKIKNNNGINLKYSNKQKHTNNKNLWKTFLKELKDLQKYLRNVCWIYSLICHCCRKNEHLVLVSFTTIILPWGYSPWACRNPRYVLSTNQQTYPLKLHRMFDMDNVRYWQVSEI